MLTFFIWILPIIICFLLIIWFYTCVEDTNNVPFLLVIVTFGASFVPIVGLFIDTCFILWMCFEADSCFKLKNNWFNRTFLAYRE